MQTMCKGGTRTRNKLCGPGPCHYMLVTIHQPDFLPWLGFFDRWERSDLYIVLDDVQFLRRGWHHRDRIKTRDGSAWLTVPVVKKGKYNQLIKDVAIDNSAGWRKKHLGAIEANYKKAPNFDYCYEGIKKIYDVGHTLLIDLNMDLLKFAADRLGITTPVTFSSDYAIAAAAGEKLLGLVKAAGGTEYLTGTGSRDYLDEEFFKREGIKVCWQDFGHPEYAQLYGEFVPALSALDYLMMKQEDGPAGG